MPEGAAGSPGAYRFRLAWLAAALASLWLRTGFPAHAIPGAAADDALFVRLASSLAAGHWLGSFDNLTLAKGMAYPAFIAAAFIIGIPLKLAEQLTYLAACWLTARIAVRPLGQWIALVLFAALAFNPALWTAEAARVIREALYLSLTLAILAVSTRIAFSPGRTAARAIAQGAIAGLIGAAFWQTREEGPWLVPAVALLTACGLAEARRLRSRAHTLRLTLSCAAALGMLVAGGLAVRTLNLIHYHEFETTEPTSAPFRRAYGAVSRIIPAQWQRWQVFPAETRARAYEASPAARELAPSLEGPRGAFWRRAGCSAGTQCDFQAGWFLWALRDAVADAGHYRSAGTAAAFYTQLAEQIDAACSTGRLRCLAPRATLAPPFRWVYVGDALRTAPALVDILLHPAAGDLGSPPSQGPAALLGAFAKVVGPVAPMAAAHDATSRRAACIIAIARLIAHLYQILLPVAAVLAIPGLLYAWRVRRRPDPALALASACLVAALCRIALLAYVQVTAIPSVNALYTLPASPLVIVLAVLGCALGLDRRSTTRL